MRSSTVPLVALLILPAMSVAVETPAADNSSPIGTRLEGFELRDYQGKTHTLDDYADRRAIVLAFLGTECPLAKIYAPRLAAIEEEFGARGVAFLGVSSNQQDAVTELAAYARLHRIPFPILKDAGNVLADEIGAERTPEVFVLDENRVVRYWGRIDDQYGFNEAGASYQRPQPERHDLAVALEELLAGKAVSRPIAKAAGCHIGRVRTPDPNAEVTYASDIAAILNNNCVYCHREGQIAPFPLTSYDEVAGWAEMIREVVDMRRMPPWHADPQHGEFSNDARLSDDELELIRRWVECGAPAGDLSTAPEPTQFAEGWQIPEPDEVIYMRDEPYTVPAEGVVEYQEFVVDPGWTEDKWIEAIEARPGNPAVVHHILVFVSPPEAFRRTGPGQLRTEWLGAFAPGLRQAVLPEGMARYVPKGSKLIFQLHYTPNGSEQQDRSYLGVVFADGSRVKKEIAVAAGGNMSFEIPPGDPDHQVEGGYTFGRDTLLLTLMPHMHLRGKDFRFDAVYPDGRREILLSVPRYDFGWQTIYALAEPKVMPAGTRLECIAHFDNSIENLNNPDPEATVRWGDQTWEEMMIGFFEIALVDQDLTSPEQSASYSRVEEFRAIHQGQGAELDPLLTAACRRAFDSPEAFDEMALLLGQRLPQLDRVCVTYVEEGKLRLALIEERSPFRGVFRSTLSSYDAEGQTLADYAEATDVIVNHGLGNSEGRIMESMAKRGIQSSLHVPGEKDGLRGSVNFWSGDESAFPPEAVELIKKAVDLMLDPSN